MIQFSLEAAIHKQCASCCGCSIDFGVVGCLPNSSRLLIWASTLAFPVTLPGQRNQFLGRISFVPNYFDPNLFWSKLLDLPLILLMIYTFLCFNIYVCMYLNPCVHTYVYVHKTWKDVFSLSQTKKTQHLWHLLTRGNHSTRKKMTIPSPVQMKKPPNPPSPI